MLRIALVPVLFLVSFAVNAEDHLFPIDLGTAHYRNAEGKDWLNSMGQDDMILVEYDVFHTFNEGEFLGILKLADGKTYVLEYSKGSYDQKKAVNLKVKVPAEFAIAVADKMEHVIRLDTRYAAKEDEEPLHIIDGDEYLFKSRFTIAQAYHGDNHGIPGQLIDACEKLVELAKVPDSDAATRKSMMDEILKDLDAIKLPEHP